MAPTELLGFAVGALRGHRLRTGLSVAGVAVGIAAVIALTALGEGARQYVVQEFSALGTNLLIVLPGKVETTGMMPFGGVVNDLTIDDYRAVTTRVPEVMRAAPLATGEETLRYGGKARSVPVIGTTEELVEVRRLKIGAGQFLPPVTRTRVAPRWCSASRWLRSSSAPRVPLARWYGLGTGDSGSSVFSRPGAVRWGSILMIWSSCPRARRCGYSTAPRSSGS